MSWFDDDVAWVLAGEPTNDHRRAANRELSRWRRELKWRAECLTSRTGSHNGDGKWVWTETVREEEGDETKKREALEDAVAVVVAKRASWGRRTREQRNEEHERRARRRALAATFAAANTARWEARKALNAEDEAHTKFRYKDEQAARHAVMDQACCIENGRHTLHSVEAWFTGPEHGEDCNQS